MKTKLEGVQEKRDSTEKQEGIETTNEGSAPSLIDMWKSDFTPLVLKYQRLEYTRMASFIKYSHPSKLYSRNHKMIYRLL